MYKYKVAVYAICKNEEQFAQRWYNSMSEADEIYVTDTGSTDNTVSFLKDLGANVQTVRLKEWRFDAARNLSLDFLPEDVDICVCTDLDEVFEQGWQKNWSARGKRAQQGQDTITPGVFIPTEAPASVLNWIKSTQGRDTDGYTRYTKCWNTAKILPKNS